MTKRAESDKHRKYEICGYHVRSGGLPCHVSGLCRDVGDCPSDPPASCGTAKKVFGGSGIDSAACLQQRKESDRALNEGRE